uniref:Homoserine acetyltransferase n=1 Tax=Candidatus Kentrum sp. DK TaxID=2126562 RepID=A0A450SB59_9GAMM|nr:MAG: Homoserine acetyltransferase [Candidatus Kentron sp. DK]
MDIEKRHKIILNKKKEIDDGIMEYVIELSSPVYLESGITAESLKIRFRTYGALNASKGNAILLFHPLSFELEGFARPDQDKNWWTKLVGPGRCLDTGRYCLIIGSIPFLAEQIAPLSPEEEALFLTFGDVARIQKNIVDYLGIPRLYAVTGGSYGAMAALAFSVHFRTSVRHAIIISATHRAHTNQIMIRRVQEKILGFMRTNSDDTESIVGLVKLISLLHYRKLDIYESFLEDEPDIEGHLEQCREGMRAKADLRLYINALRMMNAFDVSEEIESGDFELHIWAVPSDNMYTLEQHRAFYDYVARRGINAHFSIIDSDKGHDAFLMDEEKLIPCFSKILNREI